MQPGSSPTTDTDGVAATVRGAGSPVLVLHGTPGGLRTAEVMGRFLPADRFRVVSVARPGYAGTSLQIGRAHV